MDAMNKLTYELSYRDVVDIMKIIDESACRELHLEIGDFKLDLVKGPAVAGPGAFPRDSAGAAGGQVPGANPPAAAPAVQAVPAAAQKTETATAGKAEPPQASAGRRKVPRNASSIEIVTPLAGVFYRAPAPGAPPFVEVDRLVEAGDQVAIVEVMKLMNSIKAPRKGIIREILVQNENVVKMGQVLMILDPDPAAAEK